MNESLRRALLRAGMSEEDVAARLEVDPKTVRRWLEGRMPYLRHRWVLAGMLGVDETDLWPQLRAAGSVPAEVQSIYPHVGAVPREVWLRLFGSAERKIDILAGSGDGVLRDPEVRDVLAGKAQAGIAVRICLVGPGLANGARCEETGQAHAGASDGALALAEALSGCGSPAEIRLRNGPLYTAIYRADEELLVSQRVYGVPDRQTPILRVRGVAEGSLAAAYLASFERLWASQQPR